MNTFVGLWLCMAARNAVSFGCCCMETHSAALRMRCSNSRTMVLIASVLITAAPRKRRGQEITHPTSFTSVLWHCFINCFSSTEAPKLPRRICPAQHHTACSLQFPSPVTPLISHSYVKGVQKQPKKYPFCFLGHQEPSSLGQPCPFWVVLTPVCHCRTEHRNKSFSLQNQECIATC